jgi:hypothetical protein
MTELTNIQEMRRLSGLYEPDVLFVFKLLDEEIPLNFDFDGEAFKESLRQCGLLEEYEELEKRADSREDFHRSLEGNWCGFSYERDEIVKRRAREELQQAFYELVRMIGLRRRSSAEQSPKPPVLGEALLVLFCPRRRVKHVRGDLEEIFNEDVKTRSVRRAKLLYLCGVLHSIGPLLWLKLRKAGLIALLIEVGRRWGGLS